MKKQRTSLTLLALQESFFHRIAGIVSFVGENPLLPVSDQNTYYLSKWYKQVSRSPFSITSHHYHLSTMFFGTSWFLENSLP